MNLCISIERINRVQNLKTGTHPQVDYITAFPIERAVMLWTGAVIIHNLTSLHPRREKSGAYNFKFTTNRF